MKQAGDNEADIDAEAATSPAAVTRLLTEPDADPAERTRELLEIVYRQLRATAQKMMDGERVGHTLSATALVHEAYARLVGDGPMAWANRAHFFAAAAEAMRRILIEHARARHRLKRGGPGVPVAPAAPDRPATARNRIPLSVLETAQGVDPETILALDEAIDRLEKEEPEVAAVVRLRFFAGLSGDETAEALGLSARQVDRVWAYARARLFRSLHCP